MWRPIRCKKCLMTGDCTNFNRPLPKSVATMWVYVIQFSSMISELLFLLTSFFALMTAKKFHRDLQTSSYLRYVCTLCTKKKREGTGSFAIHMWFLAPELGDFFSDSGGHFGPNSVSFLYTCHTCSIKLIYLQVTAMINTRRANTIRKNYRMKK